MSKEKLQSLTKYAADIKSRLTSSTPPKHAHREESYRNWLTKELRMAESKINDLKMTAAPKEGK